MYHTYWGTSTVPICTCAVHWMLGVQNISVSRWRFANIDRSGRHIQYPASDIPDRSQSSWHWQHRSRKGILVYCRACLPLCVYHLFTTTCLPLFYHYVFSYQL